MKLTFALTLVLVAFFGSAFAVDPDILTPELPLPRRPCEPGLGLGKPFISGQEIIKERVTIDGGDYDRRFYNRREGPRRGLGFGNGQFGGFAEKRGLDY